MYYNVLHLKQGKDIMFASEIPFSADKIIPDQWNVITDQRTGQIISVRGSEIAAISSVDAEKAFPNRKTDRKKKAAQMAKERDRGGFKSTVTKS